MSDTLEQIYYNFLTRTDHPVFNKDFSDTTTINVNSPLNSILNLIFAREMVGMKAMIDELKLNSYPATVTLTTINDWELEYFGFTKAQLPLAQRVSELLIKFNKRFHMNVQDALDLSQAIVGATPIITRNLYYQGWVLGKGVLGITTALGGLSSASDEYLVEFTESVDSGLLASLDEALTGIEKAGSTHKVQAPIRFWILGSSALGVDTTI
jgi:hypothetical protein